MTVIPNMRDKTVISLVTDVNASSTVTKTKTFKRDGTITNVYIPTYPGQELDLRYRIKTGKNDKNLNNIFENLDKEYLAGNGEIFNLDTRIEVQDGDTLQVSVENNDATYAYTGNAWITIDYEGGLEGIIARFLNRFK